MSLGSRSVYCERSVVGFARQPKPRVEFRYLAKEDPMATQIVMDRTGDTRHNFDAKDADALLKAKERLRLFLSERGRRAGVLRDSLRRQPNRIDPSSRFVPGFRYGYWEREARGLELLKKWLSPEQFAQYDEKSYFEVIGLRITMISPGCTDLISPRIPR